MEKLGYKPEIQINASSSIALKASLGKHKQQFAQEKRKAEQKNPVAKSLGKHFIRPSKPKIEEPEQDDTINQQLQASWIALQVYV